MNTVRICDSAVHVENDVETGDDPTSPSGIDLFLAEQFL